MTPLYRYRYIQGLSVIEKYNSNHLPFVLGLFDDASLLSNVMGISSKRDGEGRLDSRSLLTPYDNCIVSDERWLTMAILIWGSHWSWWTGGLLGLLTVTRFRQYTRMPHKLRPFIDSERCISLKA